MENEINKLNKIIDDLRGQKVQLQDKNAELQKQLYSKEKDYLDLQLRNQELKKQVDELKADYEIIFKANCNNLKAYTQLMEQLKVSQLEAKDNLDHANIIRHEFNELKVAAEEKDNLILNIKAKYHEQVEELLSLNKRLIDQATRTNNECIILQSQYTQIKESADEMVKVMEDISMYILNITALTWVKECINKYKKHNS